MPKPADHTPRLVARVEPDAQTGALRGKLHIYDVIGGWDGIRAKDVVAKVEQLKDEGAKHLDVHIHSLGGDVFDGIAIHTVIASWDKGEKCVHVDGLAASIASFVAMAGDTVTMAPFARMMLHEPKACLFGMYSKADMDRLSTRVDSERGTLAKCYAEASGKSQDEILKMMAKETWLTADEAVKQGFADAVDGEDELDDEPESEDGSDDRLRAVAAALYTTPPPDLARLLAMSHPNFTPPAPPAPQEDTVTFDEYRKQQEADAKTIAELKTAHEAHVKVQAELLAATGKPTMGEALAVVEGLKAEAAQVEPLQAEIAKRDADAAKAAEAKKIEDVKALFDGACKAGKLTPAKRKDLEGSDKAFTKDPVQLAAFLDCLQPVVVPASAPVVEERPIGLPPTAAVKLTDEDKKLIESSGQDPILFALAKSDPSGQLVREEKENRRKAAEKAVADAAKK